MRTLWVKNCVGIKYLVDEYVQVSVLKMHLAYGYLCMDCKMVLSFNWLEMLHYGLLVMNKEFKRGARVLTYIESMSMTRWGASQSQLCWSQHVLQVERVHNMFYFQNIYGTLRTSLLSIICIRTFADACIRKFLCLQLALNALIFLH